MNVGPKDFWDLTFPEFWALYDSIQGKVEDDYCSRAQYNEMKEKWGRVKHGNA